jgi:hypothetical protein
VEAVAVRVAGLAAATVKVLTVTPGRVTMADDEVEGAKVWLPEYVATTL